MRLRVPGDKSLTHRALMIAAIAEGESRIRAPLRSEDTESTMQALESMGVSITSVPGERGDEILVQGRGLRGLTQPPGPIDCGNSGTTARLLLGLLAGQPIRATLTGDGSLSARPMGRVVKPLRLMGADVHWDGLPDRLPLTIRGGSLQAVDYALPVASAQVKSALLLAGLTGRAFVLLTEPGRSRDHTERMLAAVGAPTIGHAVGGGWRVELRDPPSAIRPLDFTVPGDPSAAAFFVAWRLLGVGDRPLHLPGVGLNPTRTGFLGVLRRMGAGIEVTERSDATEPSGDLLVRPSELVSTLVEAKEVPGLIDEIPLLAVVASRARGTTEFRGAEELRHKESDRLDAVVANLRAIGVAVEEYPDGMAVEGTRRPLSGSVETFGDHRIEMAFAVLGATDGVEIEMAGRASAAVSYPGFWSDLLGLQAAVDGRAVPSKVRGGGGEEHAGRNGKAGANRSDRRRPVVTIDGPAGSGKSTTARAVAHRLGLVHLDSGALYRALTLAVLRSRVPESEWAGLTSHDWSDFGVGVVNTGVGMTVQFAGEEIRDAELRTPEVTASVSVVAALPAVRACLLDLQRSAAAGGLVADGRDMGSIVFPDADVKVFLTADLEERARRRLLEVGGDLRNSDGVTTAAEALQKRDFQDTNRPHSPLQRADGAVVIDTTGLSLQQQVDAVVDLVLEAWPEGAGGSR